MLKLTGISHITLRVNDLRRSEEFYMKILGFKLHHRLGINMTYLESNGDSLVLVKAETPSPMGNGDIRYDHFGLRLPTDSDVDDAAAYLKEHRIHFITQPAKRRDGRAFFVSDPDGNLVEIYSSTGEIFPTDDTNPIEPSSNRRGRKAKAPTPQKEAKLREAESPSKRRRSRK